MMPPSTSTRLRGLAAVSLVALGCATKPVATPRTQVRLDPPSAGRTGTTLPDLPSAGDIAQSSSAPARTASVTAVNQDVTVVIREIARKFGLQYQIDPAVRGVVNTTFRNRTLPDALDAIVPPGMAYQVQGGVLRVGPARVTTRIFSLDYVALSRLGTATTVIQRRLNGDAIAGSSITGLGRLGATQAGGLGFSGMSGSGGGADVISAVSVADAWEEIRVAAEGLVFDAPAGGGQAQTAQGVAPAGGIGAIGSTGRPFSRVSADGRRLIINPMSGTVTVSAFPAQLEQVEAFLRAFEASVQRQVLIEAKIVEVNLDRSFEWGIDWNIIGKDGNDSIKVRSAPSTPLSTKNVELFLTGGSGQINVVLSALENQGDVRVLSSPRVSALNNQRAVFDVTTGEIVFNVSQTLIANPTPGGAATPITQVIPQQVNVGIVLDVLPQIGADNVVTMNIRPVVTSVARNAEFVGPDGTVFTAPVIDTRESDTMARLRAGETIIIGGLMQSRRETEEGGIPFLKDIPILGWLFKRYTDVERKAELVIFLTPTIIAGQPNTTR
jgi:MSHA type pilus biogenesis protein MshL